MRYNYIGMPVDETANPSRKVRYSNIAEDLLSRVNKNADSIYLEQAQFNVEVARAYIELAAVWADSDE